MISIQYFNLQQYYEQLYGENTVVLYQIGKFYEIMEFIPNDCTDDKYKMDIAGRVYNKNIGKALALSNLLRHVFMKRYNNKPYSIENPYITGFPIMLFEKYSNILLNNGYTIIKVEQFEYEKDINRKVTEILQPK